MKNMIGARVKIARKHRGISQQELADAVGVTQPSVSEWERKLTEPTTDNLASIAIALKVNFNWLAANQGEMEGYSSPALLAEESKPLETQLLELFRAQSWTNQQALIEFLKKWK